MLSIITAKLKLRLILPTLKPHKHSANIRIYIKRRIILADEKLLLKNKADTSKVFHQFNIKGLID